VSPADVVVTGPGRHPVRLGPLTEPAAWHHAEGLRQAARWDPDAARTVISVSTHDGQRCTHPDFLATLPRTAAGLAAAITGGGQAGDWPGLYTLLILTAGHQEAAALWQQAGGVSSTLLLRSERDRRDQIAGLVKPCPPPDMLGGRDLCPCGQGVSWPCGQTRVAWLARGLDPDQETRRIIQVVMQSASGGDEDISC
jgi:hypothetical protein